MKQIMKTIDCAQLSGATLLFDCNSYIYVALEEYIRESCTKKSETKYQTTDTTEMFMVKLVDLFKMTISKIISAFGGSEAILAFDGVPSTAKILEQKARRLAGGKQIINPDGTLVFSTVWFVPGHPILENLAKAVSNHVVIGPEIAGEGEHKLFTYACTKYATSDNALVFLGNDNDVFLLSMLCIARPEWTAQLYYANSFNADKESRQNAFHINTCTESLLNRTNAFHTGGSRANDKRLAIHQFVYLSLMCGNDYLPGPQRQEMQTVQYLSMLCRACATNFVGKTVDYVSMYDMLSLFFAEYRKKEGLENDMTDHFQPMYVTFGNATFLDENLWAKASLIASVEWLVMLENIFNYYVKVCSPSEVGYLETSMGELIYYPYTYAPPMWHIFLVATMIPNIKHVYTAPRFLKDKTDHELKMTEDESSKDYKARLRALSTIPMVYSLRKSDSRGRDIFKAIYMEKYLEQRCAEVSHAALIKGLMRHHATCSMNPEILNIWLGISNDGYRFFDAKTHRRMVNSPVLKQPDYMFDHPWFYPIVDADFKLRLPVPLVLFQDAFVDDDSLSLAVGKIKKVAKTKARNADLETVVI